MYNEYFGFKEDPFSIAPDPQYLYMSDQHREALAHLLYGFGNEGGFVLLTGEVGTGKTTICRCLLEQVPDNAAIAFIFNPKLTVEELLATICDEFGITYSPDNSSIKVFTDLINNFILNTHREGRKAVLIIDEAQNLSSEVLEQLRLLTNLETSKHKLLQIILLGQPELRDLLLKDELRQISQRIVARYHLEALSGSEIGPYVSHRLSVAGMDKSIFPDSTIKSLFRLSNGIPRLINLLCDRALLGTYVQGRRSVKRSTMVQAAKEVFGEDKEKGHSGKAIFLVSLFAVITAITVLLASTHFRSTFTENIQTIPDLPSQERPVDYEELVFPTQTSETESRSAAFKALFKLWGIDAGEEALDNPCRALRESGFRCLHGPDSLKNLTDLNRPAVLLLSSDHHRGFHATLVELTDDTATLIIGSERRVIPLKTIGRHWLGRFTLLWKAPQNYKGNILPGRKNPLVPWIDSRLKIAQGKEPQPRENLYFDSALADMVKEFQLSKGLTTDGIVGVYTLIHINTVTDSSVPLLIKQETGT